jgi:hypothetical protein
MAGLMLAAGSIPLRSPIPALRACPAGGALRLPARRLRRSGGLVPALVCGGLLAAALWMAPEAPQDQAAICQRHNGMAACRVW